MSNLPSFIREGERDEDAIPIYSVSDLLKIPGYQNDTITVPSGETLSIDQKISLISSDVDFVLEGTAELRIRSSLAKATWLHTKADGTFISGGGVRASLYNVEIVSTASNTTFIDTVRCTLNISGSAIAGFSYLGRMVGTGLTALDISGSRTFIDRFDIGIDLENMVISATDFVITSQTLSGDVFNIKNDIPLPIVTSFDTGITSLRPQNNVFNIDPISTDNFKMTVSGIQSSGGEGLFNTSGGNTGTFTAVTDSAVSIGIVSVSDDGNGKAAFTLEPSSDSVHIGEVVTISGYVSNTAYNTTDIIKSIPSSGTFVTSIPFKTNESGGQVSADVLTLTDIGTNIIEGSAIAVSTDMALNYDGGARVFNKQQDSFQINGIFDGDGTGIWDTSPLDHKSPAILASSNGSFAASSSTAEVSASGNTQITQIPEAGAKVLINASPWTVKNFQRFKTNENGGVIYSGLEPTPVLIDGNIYLEPINATKELSCQFVKIGAIRVPCTFNDLSNTIVCLTPHGLSTSDYIMFSSRSGTIDASIRDDIVYSIQSVPSSTEFTVSYTDGGAPIPLSGGSSGESTFGKVELSGAKVQEPVAANAPRTLIPQALQIVNTGDSPHTIVSNEEDSTNIIVRRPYYRVSQ